MFIADFGDDNFIYFIITEQGIIMIDEQSWDYLNIESPESYPGYIFQIIFFLGDEGMEALYVRIYREYGDDIYEYNSNVLNTVVFNGFGDFLLYSVLNFIEYRNTQRDFYYGIRN